MIYPGRVDWSGENPGLYLKETPDGPFVTVASFFRVVLSPHGRGHALLLLQSPGDAVAPTAAPNLCITDNEPLARWLASEFAAHFGAFRDLPGLARLEYRPLLQAETSGDASSTYAETVRSDDMEVRLEWSDLGEPFALELPPDKSATGRHVMLSLFVGAGSGSVTVNGRRLPGRPVPREMAGRQITTAFLAFSETWVRA